jgi:hypothetical protein
MSVKEKEKEPSEAERELHQSTTTIRAPPPSEQYHHQSTTTIRAPPPSEHHHHQSNTTIRAPSTIRAPQSERPRPHQSTPASYLLPTRPELLPGHLPVHRAERPTARSRGRIRKGGGGRRVRGRGGPEIRAVAAAALRRHTPGPPRSGARLRLLQHREQGFDLVVPR